MKQLFQALVLIVFVNGFLFAQDTLYVEDFANGALQNVWYPGFNGNNMDVDFLSGNPSGDGWVGTLGNDLSGGGVGQSFSGDDTWTNFYYEAWVYVPVDSGTYYGIEFRVDSVGITSGYQFLARFKQGASDLGLRFRARSGASPTTIHNWLDNDIPGGVPTTSGWHKLAVNAIGDQFWFYYDGQELPGNPYTDNTYSSGWIGVYIWDFMLSPIHLYIDDIIVLTEPPVGIEDQQPNIISEYRLHQNFPNPFNPSTTISFFIPGSENVTVDIFNNLGQKVRTLVNGRYAAGDHQFEWDARNDLGQLVPAGVYYYRLQAGNFQDTKKMLLIK
jgi:hypothetical protein